MIGTAAVEGFRHIFLGLNQEDLVLGIGLAVLGIGGSSLFIPFRNDIALGGAEICHVQIAFPVSEVIDDELIVFHRVIECLEPLLPDLGTLVLILFGVQSLPQGVGPVVELVGQTHGDRGGFGIIDSDPDEPAVIIDGHILKEHRFGLCRRIFFQFDALLPDQVGAGFQGMGRESALGKLGSHVVGNGQRRKIVIRQHLGDGQLVQHFGKSGIPAAAGRLHDRHQLVHDRLVVLLTEVLFGHGGNQFSGLGIVRLRFRHFPPFLFQLGSQIRAERGELVDDLSECVVDRRAVLMLGTVFQHGPEILEGPDVMLFRILLVLFLHVVPGQFQVAVSFPDPGIGSGGELGMSVFREHLIAAVEQFFELLGMQDPGLILAHQVESADGKSRGGCGSDVLSAPLDAFQIEHGVDQVDHPVIFVASPNFRDLSLADGRPVQEDVLLFLAFRFEKIVVAHGRQIDLQELTEFLIGRISLRSGRILHIVFCPDQTFQMLLHLFLAVLADVRNSLVVPADGFRLRLDGVFDGIHAQNALRIHFGAVILIILRRLKPLNKPFAVFGHTLLFQQIEKRGGRLLPRTRILLGFDAEIQHGHQIGEGFLGITPEVIHAENTVGTLKILRIAGDLPVEIHRRVHLVLVKEGIDQLNMDPAGIGGILRQQAPEEEFGIIIQLDFIQFFGEKQIPFSLGLKRQRTGQRTEDQQRFSGMNFFHHRVGLLAISDFVFNCSSDPAGTKTEKLRSVPSGQTNISPVFGKVKPSRRFFLPRATENCPAPP